MAGRQRKSPEPKVNSVGNHLHWSEADLDRLSEVTPEDVTSGLAAWEANAPGPAKRLLRAKPRTRTPKGGDDV